jgi:Chaperone of endosialidase/Head domain of trimeric autotransporter adhesin
MMQKFVIINIALLFYFSVHAQTGKIGINTNTPQAMLHVKDSSVLFSGGINLPGTPGNPPTNGTGIRMMWYPAKAAFRAGRVDAIEWDYANVGLTSVAMGYNTIANGTFSTAMGGGTNASGEYSTAMGRSTTASGEYSTAMGLNTTANSGSSTAMGYNTTTIGYASIAMGSSTTASGSVSIAMGSNTTASGSISSALGYSTRAKGYASTVIGMYNDAILSSDETEVTPGTPLFIVGNGEFLARKNAFVVLKNGNVGIGQLIPEYRFDVGERMRLRSGGTAGTSAGIWLNDIGNTTTPAFIGMADDSHIGFYGTGAGWDLVMNLATGNVGVGTQTPTQKLHVIGNICYTGSIGACSDIRYKKNITPIRNALNSVLNLNGIFYTWEKEKFKDKGFTDERQLGFSAQEVEKLYPEIVQTDAYKSVDYGRLTPVLVEAIKEQQQQIDALKKMVNTLSEIINKKL